MTQEQQTRLEQLAKAEIDNSVWSNEDDSLPLNVAKKALIRLAQTILDNPSEWGLVNKDSIAYDISEMESQLTKYREALERIASEVNPYIKSHENMWRIVFEALKNNEG